MIKNCKLDKETLEELYIRQNKSTLEIGKEYGMTGEGVSYRLKKYGIARKDTAKRISDKASMSGKENIYLMSKDRFIELLNQYGQRKIGELCGCSKQLVETIRKKHGIDAVTKEDRINYKLNNSFDDLQRNLIYGSLLGDGCIRLSENRRTARYKESHSTSQSRYIEWKYDILKDYVNKPVSLGFKHWRDGRKIEELRFSTCYHKNFIEFYDMFYDEQGKKHLPDNFEETLNPFILAVWFMDDGSYHGNEYTIASNFSESEIDRVVVCLKEQFGLRCRVVKNDVFNLHFDKDEFFDVVKHHIIKDMSYKIFENQRFGLSCINHVELQKYYHGMPDNPTEQEIKEIADFFLICGFPYTKPHTFDRDKMVEQIKHYPGIIVDNHIKQVAGNVGNDFLLSCFPNFYDVRHDDKPSAKYWFDNKLEHIISDIYKYYKKKPTKSVLRNCLIEHGKITTFRTVVAKQIYDRYGKDDMSVLDPCAGWGGRMLGAYCCDKVKRYDCVDACSDTVRGLNHVRCLMNRKIENKDVNVTYGCFEEFDSAERYDLIFTSPPYFSKERYSNEEKQSWKRYPDYESWKNGFLKSFVDNSYRLISDDGYFIVNIDDVKIGGKNYPLIMDFLDLTKGKFELFETLFMDYQNKYSKITHGEPIFVMTKSKRSNLL